MRAITPYILPFLLLLVCCREQEQKVTLPEPQKESYAQDSIMPGPETYYDRVLGGLVGSAIGDAMGASTEMWYRKDIQLKYGYITGLTPAVRQESPEGTWENNLQAGATTDDTRWKYLMVKYFSGNSGNTGPEAFARFIASYYQSVAGDLADREILKNPDALAGRLEKVDWIREWARVALAYTKGPEDYEQALSRFYGGEMACAGMLYSPVFGLLSPNPEAAYRTAYEHSLFDHGYAKDITAQVAAMTQTALQGSSMDSILDTSVFVDPYRYQDSRLLGRISLQIADATRNTVRLAKEGPTTGTDTIPPPSYPGTSADWSRQDYIYSYLEKNERAVPFHAGEIWQIVIAGLAYGQGDFQKTMEFIINYGRDNDTTAAVAGMILGTRLGFSGLPVSLRTTIVRTNREKLGIDLEELAREIVAVHQKKSP